jgi:hypothetical protein
VKSSLAAAEVGDLCSLAYYLLLQSISGTIHYSELLKWWTVRVDGFDEPQEHTSLLPSGAQDDVLDNNVNRPLLILALVNISCRARRRLARESG